MCKTPFRNNVLHKTKKSLSFLNGLAEEERFELWLIRRGGLRRFAKPLGKLIINKKAFDISTKGSSMNTCGRGEIRTLVNSPRRTKTV